MATKKNNGEFNTATSKTNVFEKFSTKVSKATGSTGAFISAFLVVLADITFY